MRREVGQASFAEALVQGGGNRRLERIAGLIDWAPVERLLEGVYASATGRPANPPLVMLKVLLLESWYGLGDGGGAGGSAVVPSLCRAWARG